MTIEQTTFTSLAESGELWRRSVADGNPVDSGGEEMAFPLGTWCYTAPDTMDGVRNDGAERASALILELIPTTE